MKKIFLTIGVLIILLVLLTTGFRGSEERAIQTSKENSKVMQIGVVLPLTGDAAVYGEPARQVMELAAKEINTKNKSSGIQLKLVFEDGGCEGKTAASAFKKLVDTNKIKIAIGGICSSETLAILPLAEQYGVAIFSPTASSTELTAKSKMFARNIPSDQSQGVELAKYIKSQKWRSVATISEKTPFALSTTTAIEEALRGSNIAIYKEEFASGTTTFQTQLAKLKLAEPEALFISTQAGPATERILTQLQELKWRPKLLLIDNSLSDEALLGKFSNFLEGSVGAQTIGGDNAKSESLRNSYYKTYQKELPFEKYSQLEYDSIFLLHEAITNVGYDGLKVSNWLHTQVKNWPGASGPTNIDASGDRLDGRSVFIIKNGKPVILNNQ